MIKIYNTLNRKKEEFKTIEKNTVNIYVCGVTVYDFCHLGHGRTFSIFDMMLRYFHYCGYNTNYVRNITDIDDKIIEKARINNESINSLSTRMIVEMQKDFSSLNILKPNYEPKVTDYINEIIKIISILMKKKYAYLSNNGDVMFSIKKYPKYGTLSNKKKFFKNFFFNDQKKVDFVLWKKSKKKEPKWLSPWGLGRPGWHVECSAINNRFLGAQFDIHGGGQDLIFPHHENEIAQSACAIKNFNIKHWIHTGMVMFEKKKMSKSLNNIFTIRNILLKFDSETIRYFFLSSHYRSPLNFDLNTLNSIKKSLNTLYFSLKNLDLSLQDLTFKKNDIFKKEDFEKDFEKAMNDDFNTPKVFSILFELAHEINITKKRNMNIANYLGIKLKKLGNILGILNEKPKSFFQNKKKLFLEKNDIEDLINRRNLERKNKQWEKADKIRDKLKKYGILLEDIHNQTFWRKK